MSALLCDAVVPSGKLLGAGWKATHTWFMLLYMVLFVYLVGYIY